MGRGLAFSAVGVCIRLSRLNCDLWGAGSATKSITVIDSNASFVRAVAL